MKKVNFNADFLHSLSFSQLEDIVNYYKAICKEKDRYFHYQGKDDWDLRNMEQGMILGFVVRNNDEISFNNHNYHVDNDVAMAMVRNKFDFQEPTDNKAIPIPGIDDVFFRKSFKVNCEPVTDKMGRGHLRSCMLIGSHEKRAHNYQHRNFEYHENGPGNGKLITEYLSRTAICQRGDGPTPILRTDGKGKIMPGYKANETSWEKGRGFNFHDVYSNSSLGCITVPQVNKTDDRYMWYYKPVLDKASIRDYAALILISCDTLMEICDDLKIDYSNCEVTTI